MCVIFTDNFCVRRCRDVSLRACVPLISVGLYMFVNVSVFAPQRVHVSFKEDGDLCVCFGDAQCKLFKVGSMEFGLGLAIPLLLHLNCGSDCLTPTSSCVLPSPHASYGFLCLHRIYPCFISSFSFLSFPYRLYMTWAETGYVLSQCILVP